MTRSTAAWGCMGLRTARPSLASHSVSLQSTWLHSTSHRRLVVPHPWGVTPGPPSLRTASPCSRPGSARPPTGGWSFRSERLHSAPFALVQTSWRSIRFAARPGSASHTHPRIHSTSLREVVSPMSTLPRLRCASLDLPSPGRRPSLACCSTSL